MHGAGSRRHWLPTTAQPQGPAVLLPLPAWLTTKNPPRPTHCPPLLQVEGIALDEDSLTYLGEIGEETSLRHAVQASPSAQLERAA